MILGRQSRTLLRHGLLRLLSSNRPILLASAHIHGRVVWRSVCACPAGASRVPAGLGRTCKMHNRRSSAVYDPSEAGLHVSAATHTTNETVAGVEPHTTLNNRRPHPPLHLPRLLQPALDQAPAEPAVQKICRRHSVALWRVCLC